MGGGKHGEALFRTIKAAGDGRLQYGRVPILVELGESGRWIFRQSHLGKR